MQLVTQVDMIRLFHIQQQVVVGSKTEDWTELRTTAPRLCSIKSSATKVPIKSLSQKANRAATTYQNSTSASQALSRFAMRAK